MTNSTAALLRFGKASWASELPPSCCLIIGRFGQSVQGLESLVFWPRYCVQVLGTQEIPNLAPCGRDDVAQR